MTRRFLTALGVGLALACLALTPGEARADLVLGFSSDAPDPLHIAVDQIVTFQVLLTGLGDSGNPSELSELGVDVAYDSTLFGMPTVSAGAIVPDPSIDSFTPVEIAGSAGAVYDTIFSGAMNISADGIFFTFTVKALRAGSGTLGFSPSPSAFDSSNDPVTLDSSATYAFSISSQAVPEPSSLVLLSVALCGAASRKVIRRGRRR